jgi:hypothetical protein
MMVSMMMMRKTPLLDDFFSFQNKKLAKREKNDES